MMTIDVGHAMKRVGDMYRDYPNQLDKALALAVNEAARFGRTASAKEIRTQVRFPAQYLSDGTNGRLKVGRRAKPGDPEAHIVARHRPTSLLRFATGVSRRSKYVSVKVKPTGSAQRIRGAFRVKLRSGSDELGNEGLAIRIKPGATFTGGKGAKLREDKQGETWLMYGPSVNQVFNKTRDIVGPAILARMEAEFDRQIGRLAPNVR